MGTSVDLMPYRSGPEEALSPSQPIRAAYMVLIGGRRSPIRVPHEVIVGCSGSNPVIS